MLPSPCGPRRRRAARRPPARRSRDLLSRAPRGSPRGPDRAHLPASPQVQTRRSAAAGRRGRAAWHPRHLHNPVPPTAWSARLRTGPGRDRRSGAKRTGDPEAQMSSRLASRQTSTLQRRPHRDPPSGAIVIDCAGEFRDRGRRDRDPPRGREVRVLRRQARRSRAMARRRCSECRKRYTPNLRAFTHQRVCGEACRRRRRNRLARRRRGDDLDAQRADERERQLKRRDTAKAAKYHEPASDAKGRSYCGNFRKSWTERRASKVRMLSRTGGYVTASGPAARLDRRKGLRPATHSCFKVRCIRS